MNTATRVRGDVVRGRRGRMTAAIAAGAVSLGLMTASAMQPEGGKPAKAKKEAAPVLLVERASLDKMVVDPRDAAMANAIGMLPARLRELPGEIPGAEQIPPPVLEMLIALASRPARLGLTYNAGDQTGGAFGMGLIASVLARDEAQAQNMQGTVNGLLSMGGNEFKGEPSEKYRGMSEAPLPVVGVLRYGARKSGDSWRYEVHAGSAGDPDATFATLPAPARPGFEPVLRARLDLSTLTPLVEQFKAMAGDDPQAEQGFNALAVAGLIGPDAVKYSFQYGYLPDRSLSVTVSEGMKKHAAAMGVSTTPLNAEDYKSIPADAYVAGLRRIDLSKMQETIEGLAESQPQMAEGLAQFQQATGVDLVKDVLGSLGGTMGYYMADSTGGLGLMSAVALVQFKDRAKFDTASAKLTSFANTALAAPTKGYVRARAWAEGDAKMVSITFPGIPIPLEVTYTTTERFLILALSPQAAVAAARQATGKGDGGLMSNAAFAGTLPKGKEFESVGFMDTPRTMASGYQYLCLIGSAVANGVRSPRDPGREPGVVVPTYGELRKDARALVSFGYFEGDNLVRESQGNRSVLTETCGALGALSPFIPVIAGAAGVAALTGARQAQMVERRLAPPPPMPDNDEGDAPKPVKKKPPARRTPN